MRRSLSAGARLLCLAAFALFSGSLAVQAKIVAIVFDNSGSMGERYQLPSFGARLLIATVDGRAGFDRLLIMNFSDFLDAQGTAIPVPSTVDRFARSIPQAIQSHEITSGTQHQSVVNQQERIFRYDSDNGTPYGPIEVMLDRISKEIGDGEEAVMVLVSDGEYGPDTEFQGGRLVPQMRNSFNEYRSRIADVGGNLSVKYLFIDQEGGSELRNLVREQGVRDTLIEVFNEGRRAANGKPEGSHYVSNGDDLWNALKDIIASVSGTDRAAQSDFISMNGATISLESPLSISRVVIVSTANKGAFLPQMESNNFPVDPTDQRRVSTDMNGSDAAFSGTRPRQGIAQHLWFQNPVPPGQYELTFNGPVSDDVFLLFETRSIVDLRIFDDKGTEVLASPNGEFRVFSGRRYEFRSQILDGVGAPRVVEFSTLPNNLTMALSLDDGGGGQTNSMSLKATDNIGVSGWSPVSTGAVSAFARASAGILSPRSKTLRIVVEDATAELTIHPIRPDESCPQCEDGVVSSSLQAGKNGGGSAVRIGEFDVSADATFDGAALISPNMPDGYEIRDDEGNIVDPTKPVPFGKTQTRTFSIWRPFELPDEQISQGATQIEVSVTPAGPWSGTPRKQQTQVLLSPPGMSLVLAAVSQPISVGRLDGLSAPAGELLLGQFSAQYSMVDVLAQPNPADIKEQVSVEGNRSFDWLLAYELSYPDPALTGFNALEIKPTTNFICLCWIWAQNGLIGTDRRNLSVRYSYEVQGTIIQQADAILPLSTPVGQAQGGLSCLLNILYALIAYMFMRGIIALITTHRFPKGSSIEITEPDNRVRFVRLDKGNTVWLKAWFAAITGNPNEKRIIEGMKLTANHRGATLDVSKSTPPWELERFGQSFEELKETQPNKTKYDLSWGDEMQSLLTQGRKIRFKKGPSR